MRFGFTQFSLAHAFLAFTLACVGFYVAGDILRTLKDANYFKRQPTFGEIKSGRAHYEKP